MRTGRFVTSRDRKRLCWVSSGSWALRTPVTIVANQAVEQSQQLAHARGDGDLERFAGSPKTLVECLDERIAAAGGKCSHVQRAANRSAAAADGPFAAKRAGVAVERRQADEGGDLLAIELAQFRQLGDERRSEERRVG